MSATNSPVRITIDLAALGANFAKLRALAESAEVAAVVKANAYGLGMGPVAVRLVAEGCRTFFVSTLAEGMELRRLQGSARIFVLNEMPADSVPLFLRHDLLPVLNTLDEMRAWAARAATAPAALQIDTGITRAGLSGEDLAALNESRQLRSSLNLVLVMSHLACADEPDHPMNHQQLERFGALRQHWPRTPWSIANSAGILLGPRFHGDLVRPGIALYGGRPCAVGANPMTEVLRLEGRVLQIRKLTAPASVGYGATQRLTPPARVATVGLGYADGYPRSLGGRGFVFCNGQRAPLVGRVSMDLLTIDVSAAAHAALAVGEYVTLLGGGAPLEEIAALAGTVNYELLTSLSRRAERIYR